jgi:hypothetical protein
MGPHGAAEPKRESKMLKSVSLTVVGAFLLALSAGCSDRSDQPTSTITVEGKKYLLAAEPAGAKGAAEVIEKAAAGDEVVVVGRIGGDVTPWIEGAAAFLIVDPSLPACNDKPGDNCPTPWDYCCDTDKLPKLRTTVKLVDQDGKLLQTDAREMLGVKELQTVVVRGRADRDDSGNLTILADSLFVRSP